MTREHIMDNDAISFQQPTGTRPPDRRAALWDELERLHAQLGIAPPTATYTLEALAEDGALARRAVHQPAVVAQTSLHENVVRTLHTSDVLAHGKQVAAGPCSSSS